MKTNVPYHVVVTSRKNKETAETANHFASLCHNKIFQTFIPFVTLLKSVLQILHITKIC